MRYRFAANLALIFLVYAPLAQAQSAASKYPTRPIKLVVGYTPGGGTDIMGRMIAQQMSERLGETVVVENKPGAGQNIGAAYVARADPDGYTLFLSSSALAINVSLFDKLDYDPIKSFAPAAMFGQSSNLLVISSTVPAKTVRELVDYGKKNPGKLNFSSSGHGSTQHLSGELFKQVTGMEIIHVPYRGSGPSIAGVQSGEVQMTFINIPSMAALFGSDKIRVLGITSLERSPAVPDVPTMAEAGVDGMDVAAWYGVLAPAGTPPEIVAKLNKVINEAVADPKFKKQLIDSGADPLTSTPESFSKFLAEDIARWKKVIAAAGTKVE